ncbi:DUF4349 domain-containing protein [Roseimaritima ulvae]|uniref:DUF4349 domain-containing protein n=1 Tax=Roseimaritima ulvae TaxID=980254 RepID=A0A5B9QK33_9BACT|nr:DUF4349 domain-containing protein [Roseimaritima ulvae]QEG39467.1 hypothetical protein UC8_14620 [Roseimaritima ulvae]
MIINRHRRVLFAFHFGVCALAILGCGGESYQATESFDGGKAMPGSSSGVETATADAVASSEIDVSEIDPDDSEAGSQRASAAANRKIIYDTTIGLVVEDYQRFESQLPGIVAKHGGFVSHSDTDRSYNDQQRGTWVIRVPVDSYAAFLSGVDTLGFAESRQENAQDVTEEYVDVQARIANKKSLEQRIIQLLEDRSGKLADVLEIERELARVREEIERMEGRLRVLKDRTSLATVTINCREQRAYQPPAAPTLGSRIRRAWGDSLYSLQLVGENLLVILIAAVPWLLVLGIPLLILWKILQRIYRRYQ